MTVQRDPVQQFSSLRRLDLWKRRRTIPVIRQLAIADCGAAALAMVLGFWGKYVSLDELKRTIGQGRDGSSAASLLRAARLYGLRGRGIRLEVEELRAVPKGAILHWEFRHFLVFEKLRRNGVDVVDPAVGRRTIPMEKFNLSFTGIALVFEPTDSFIPGSRDTRKFSGLIPQIFEQKALVAKVAFSSLVVQILAAIVPLFTGVLIDKVVPHRDYSLLVVLTAGYCCFQVFNVVAAFIRAHLLIYLRIYTEAGFTLRFLDHLIDLPYEFFQQHTTGDLMVRLGSNNTVREILTSATLSALMDGTMASVYMILLLLANLRLTLMVMVLAAGRLCVLLLLRWRQRELVAEQLENQARSQTYEVEMLNGMETLKAMGVEYQAAENWSHLFVDRLNIAIKQGKLEAVYAGLLNVLGGATSLVFVFYAGFLVLRGELTLGTMMAFSALAGGFLGPLTNLVNATLQLQTVEVYLERLNDVMNAPTEQNRRSVDSLSANLSGSLSLDHVSFRYNLEQALVLDGITVGVEAGMRVAIVGRTGCGKSTLARLMAGLYTPTAGRVLFDDKDLNGVDIRSVRRQLGIVTQDTQLFGGTIRQNIALTDPDMPFERIVWAAKIAAIHSDIVRMPMGYETRLADHGSSLSGGQRQRLALARALARRPRVLILDEATSHLDAGTEATINANLALLNCTQIVIAHRLSTIRHADLIIVLSGARIAEHGTHMELLQLHGIYAALVADQQEGDSAEKRSLSATKPPEVVVQCD